MPSVQGASPKRRQQMILVSALLLALMITFFFGLRAFRRFSRPPSDEPLREWYLWLLPTSHPGAACLAIVRGIGDIAACRINLFNMFTQPWRTRNKITSGAEQWFSKWNSRYHIINSLSTGWRSLTTNTKRLAELNDPPGGTIHMSHH